MSGFSVDWLNLREPADQRARDQNLLAQAGSWLKTHRSSNTPMTIVDLGAGTGATLRALGETAVAGSGQLSWRLVDNNPVLLADARRRHGDKHLLETFELDLADIPALPLEGAQLVTASALFDLVSAPFVDALAKALRNRTGGQPAGLYAALNYDGTTIWSPAHPMDAPVLSAFNRDQRRDKGLGPALGPDAANQLEQTFNKLEFKVLTASSPWLLGEHDGELLHALIDGIVDAVAADPALDGALIGEWMQFRKAHIAEGSCEIGHSDVLALPDYRS